MDWLRNEGGDQQRSSSSETTDYDEKGHLNRRQYILATATAGAAVFSAKSSLVGTSSGQSGETFVTDFSEYA